MLVERENDGFFVEINDLHIAEPEVEGGLRKLAGGLERVADGVPESFVFRRKVHARHGAAGAADPFDIVSAGRENNLYYYTIKRVGIQDAKGRIYIKKMKILSRAAAAGKGRRADPAARRRLGKRMRKKDEKTLAFHARLWYNVRDVKSVGIHAVGGVAQLVRAHGSHP